MFAGGRAPPLADQRRQTAAALDGLMNAATLSTVNAMRLAEVIRAKKDKVRYSTWNTGKVPNAFFPLAKKGTLPAGSSWAWKVLEFRALARYFRVLIRLNEEKEYFSAILAMDDPRGVVVMCHHELHTSHRDWHCHLVPCDVTSIHPGVLRDKEKMRLWPSTRIGQCSVRFFIDKHKAVTIAAALYRIAVQGDQELLL